jgi:hypothetical protein
MKAKTASLPKRKPRAWQGKRRAWGMVDYPAGVDLRDPEACAHYLLEARDQGPEAYAIAKQTVNQARMTEGNKAVRTFTCHDSVSGASRLYFCAA